jgi:hypothetical protein
MTIACYSQRLLSPFRGVMSIIEMDEADAVSLDGKSWAIYVHDERDPWVYQDNLDEHIITPDVKYGNWSEESGFLHGPVLSTMDYPRIQKLGRAMLEIIKKKQSGLPFQLKDNYELWLLDGETDAPLVLLDSTCIEDNLNEEILPCWIPGQRCKHLFKSEALCLQHQPLSAAEMVSMLINEQAGAQPKAQWFWRDDNGRGFALQGKNISDSLISRELEYDAFPQLLLDTHWVESDAVGLLYDYIAWQAPLLLLLQNVTPDVRQELEIEASKQALTVANLYLLYPEFIDKYILNSIRVEARMRGKETKPGIEEDNSLSAYV